MTFKTEFPDFPEADMPPIPNGFIDSSWHNDACPSYSNEDNGLVIFIDYVDHGQREIPECGERFSLFDMNAQAEVKVSDEWSEIVAAAEAFAKVASATGNSVGEVLVAMTANEAALLRKLALMHAEIHEGEDVGNLAAAAAEKLR